MLGLRKIITSKTHEYEVVLICRSTKATGKMFIQNKQDLMYFIINIDFAITGFGKKIAIYLFKNST